MIVTPFNKYLNMANIFIIKEINQIHLFFFFLFNKHLISAVHTMEAGLQLSVPN